MFEAIIHRAQNSVESVVSKYVLRVAVAVPFIVALGFGTAAASVKLIATYGDVTAYAILAAAFGAIGLVAAAAIATTGSRPPAAASEAANEAKDAAAAVEPGEQSPSQLSPDLLLTALGVVGPRALPAIPVMMRFIVKNWALVVAVAILAFLLLSEKTDAQRAAETEAGQ